MSAPSACNRVAIVTGGAQGIGRGIAKFLLSHQAGVNKTGGTYGPSTDGPVQWGVVVVDTDEAGLEDAKRLFTTHKDREMLQASDKTQATHTRVAFLTGDCAEESTAKKALTLALSTFGRVDLLVNNAGGGLNKVPLRGQTMEEFYETLHRNVGTAYAFSKVVGGHWEAIREREHAALQGASGASTPPTTTTIPRTGGPFARNNVRNAIVNNSSTRAHQSEHFSEAYAAGKGGVVALTHALASSMAHVARVNAISLGWIDVSGPEYGPGREAYELSKADISQHWCNKVGEPDDVAHAVMFLYENYFMDGQTITLDGGMTKRMHYVD